MTDLTTTQNSPPSRPTTPELGKALSELLDATGSPDAAVQAIIDDPALLSEARRALPALKAVAQAKAGIDGVRRVIAKRFEIYPQPQRTDEQWAAWWADYYDALSDQSLASLEAGMRAYVADPSSEFMPKPGRLRELAFTAPCRALGRYYRAQRAVNAADAPVALSGPRVDPLAVRSMLADYEAKAGVGVKVVKPVLPNTAGEVDEGGLTQAMRELMARREAAE